MSNSAHPLSVVTSGPDRPTDRSSRPLPAWWPLAALGLILVLAALLYGWALGSLGWANTYYSAAVKSMGQSWSNFLFGSYDPAGVITVDKPPAALWPQVISTKVFGLHGWAMVLPQLIEGVAAVFVLHRTVRRWAGESAALIAALAFTLTPITVAINRDNNPDTLLILLLVAAAYALTRALQAEGRAAAWWLCASGFLIGCGFLTKMLAAWMVIPAFAVAWLVGGSGAWIPRVRRLLGAGAVLAASSLWWVAMVALWPGDRPYIGGSEDGSAWDLVIGYNGLGRVFGSDSGGQGRGGGGGFGGGAFGGAAGPGRLFNDQVAGQISWLLPVSAVALAVAVACAVLRRRGRLPGSAVLPAQGWLLWGTWLVVCAAVFSTQEGIFHPYYTTQLAPAIAALCGGLTVALVRAHRAGHRWPAWVGAGAVAASAAWAGVLIRRTPDWNGWLVWPVLLAGCAAIALLLLARGRGRLLTVAAGAAVAAVLVAPGAWAVSVPGSTSAMGGSNPTAGPTVLAFGGGGGMPQPGSGGGNLPSGLPSGMPSGMPSGGSDGFGSGSGSGGRGAGGFGGGAELTGDQRKILNYVVEHAPDARIKLAVEGGAMSTSAFVLGSDETVIGMGGFSGGDDAPSVAQLEKWTKNGELRYILGSDAGGGFPAVSGSPSQQRSDWISDNCTKVSASEYGVSSSQQSGGGRGFGANVLYDCAAE
ncbi:glycosyltransferase family 39 protein [Streptomyces sp. GESEQ-35]|uniref:ArnT family glycosyltransferase n=1 Tax=Streptomyces sp. GESEQ-35 TaxID=2812657 RepID=UPI001B34098D|nr:glycosyltransferase family 39 protein [Streptomyces sp. GESEQ-35]